MKKRNLTFAVLLLAVVCTAFGVSGTYARYIAEDTGTAKASVAKWSVVMSGTNESGTNTTWDKNKETVQTLKLTPVTNQYVATGYIAPASNAEGELLITLTGTQVATDLEVSLTDLSAGAGASEELQSALTAALKNETNTDGNISVELKAYAGTTGTSTPVTISDDGTISLSVNDIATGGKNIIRLVVSLVWSNDEDLNANDTVIGEGFPELTATLSVTAKQHIAADDPVVTP